MGEKSKWARNLGLTDAGFRQKILCAQNFIFVNSQTTISEYHQVV